MMPPLPPDIWYRIACFSPPETLSALSEVSTTFNKLATHETHFTRQISVTHLHPMQAFRREEALHHPPANISSTPKYVSRIFQANDMALLHDSRKHSLVAFPTGHIFPISHDGRYVMTSSYTPLIDETIGFVAASKKQFCMFDLRSGDVSYVPLLKKGHLFERNRPVVLAGNQGEWLLQRTDDKLMLYDRFTGDTKLVLDVPKEVTLVMGELSTSHDGTCVGYATSSVERGVRTVTVHGFDGLETTFQVSVEDNLESVLRSEDSSTHVLVTQRENANSKHFIASRGSMVWYGDLREIARPRLCENGTVIVESKLVNPAQRQRSSGHATVCFILHDIEKRATLQSVRMKRVKRYTTIVWMRRIRGYLLTLVTGRGKDKLELVKMSYENGHVGEKLLKEWIIPEVMNVHVIADHYILATSRSQVLHLLHFDRFCNGVDGVYACPLVGLSTYCYFPDQFREDDDDLRKGKRRRIDGGSHDDVEWV